MSRDAQVLGRGIKTVFILVGGLTLLVGLVMFFLPEPSGVGTTLPNGSPANDQLWPWPLRTALITRFFGALFTGVGVGAFWAARHQTWGQVRGLFPPGLTFTALATAAALLHMGSFDQQRLTTWAFFATYILVLVAGLITFVTYERGSA
jgi:hypothetical protein